MPPNFFDETSEDDHGENRFTKNIKAAEALRPDEVRTSAARYRQLADGILQQFRELTIAAEGSDEETPPGLEELRHRAEHLRGHADALFDFADRAEETKALAHRLRGIHVEQLEENEKQSLALSLHNLYDRLPQGLVG